MNSSEEEEERSNSGEMRILINDEEKIFSEEMNVPFIDIKSEVDEINEVKEVIPLAEKKKKGRPKIINKIEKIKYKKVPKNKEICDNKIFKIIKEKKPRKKRTTKKDLIGNCDIRNKESDKNNENTKEIDIEKLKENIKEGNIINEENNNKENLEGNSKKNEEIVDKLKENNIEESIEKLKENENERKLEEKILKEIKKSEENIKKIEKLKAKSQKMKEIKEMKELTKTSVDNNIKKLKQLRFVSAKKSIKSDKFKKKNINLIEKVIENKIQTNINEINNCEENDCFEKNYGCINFFDEPLEILSHSAYDVLKKIPNNRLNFLISWKNRENGVKPNNSYCNALNLKNNNYIDLLIDYYFKNSYLRNN